MIHIPAEHVRNEMLSLQQLTRATLSDLGDKNLEPTLVIKTKSLALKYLFRKTTVRILIGKMQGQKLMYGLLIEDDPQSPYCCWSLVERSDEKQALRRIASGERFMLAMFNEVVLNVGGALVSLQPASEEIQGFIENLSFAHEGEWQSLEPEVDAMLYLWHSQRIGIEELRSEIIDNWMSNQSVYVTNQLHQSQINLLDPDEGGQQEQLGAWITDSLHPSGVYQNPVAQEKVPRELCDLLLTYEFGTFLFESKALTIFSRTELPNREKLQSDVEKHIKKALRQLAGACKNIRSGIEVLTSNSGDKIQVQREISQNCIILVPDLTLLNNIAEPVFEGIEEFHSKSKAIVNIVDPSQLFNLMMDSNNLVYLGKSTTPMMAFDNLLMRRFEGVFKSRKPHIVALADSKLE